MYASSLHGYADSYDPASGPPTLSWDPNVFASIDEYNAEFERAANKFRDFLVRGGIATRVIPSDPGSAIVNAIPFGPSLPTVDVVRAAAAATMQRTGQDTIDPNAWKAIYANVPDVGSADGGETYYVRPTFVAPKTVDVKTAQALATSLVEAANEARAAAAVQRTNEAATVNGSDAVMLDPRPVARMYDPMVQQRSVFDAGTKEAARETDNDVPPWVADETGQPVPFSPSTSLVRASVATQADGVQGPRIAPAVVAGVALLVLLLLPKKRR